MDVFLISIGGTGMRCLEAFTHLCAMGMMEDRTIHVLSIDTDYTNKNKDNAEKLIESYTKIKGATAKSGGVTHKDTFFSANIRLYKFTANYTTPERSQLRQLLRISMTNEDKLHPLGNFDNNLFVREQMLADLFFDEEVQTFNLSKGYRAQTHLGSMLMYRSILEEFSKKDKQNKASSELHDFWLKLSQTDAARVFIFGSLFGGTGASSLPIIPQAFKDALEFSGQSVGLKNDVNYGAALLSQYFTFTSPDERQRNNEKVIATADKFAVNSQAALMYYTEDISVAETFKSLYIIGWEQALEDYSPPKKEGSQSEVKIGGVEQENPAHIVEMLTAAAALDFFTNDIAQSEKAKYYYRSVDEKDGKYDFDFTAFVKNAEAKRLEIKKRTTAYLALSLILQNHYNGKSEDLLKGIRTTKKKPDLYKGLDDNTRFETFDGFMSKVHIEYENESIKEGFFYKLQRSTGNKEFLGYKAALFDNNIKGMKNINWAELTKTGKYAGSWLQGKNDLFVDTFVKTTTSENISDDFEKYINHLYKTLLEIEKISL